MRELDTKIITDAVAEGLYKINHRLSTDMENAVCSALSAETDKTGKLVLSHICENMKIADAYTVPICQDTGMAVVFARIGQDVHLCGKAFEDAVNDGVRRAYKDGYLRKSVVVNPLERVNTKDNAPAVIHTSIVPGESVEITVCAKGFGSENCSRLFMMKPSDGREGVISAVLTAVKDAGPNACPPLVIGVGIGGDFEKCAIMAKHALTRNLNSPSQSDMTAELEAELLKAVNSTGIGAAGLGGSITALAVNVETYPTHIAGLPVAVNICCHVNRHMTFSL